MTTNTKKITVALADDHQLVRHGIKLMVEGFHDYEVVLEASNGRELIEKLGNLEKLPDLALIDVSMPVMDGIESMEYLGTHYKSIKCIALSIHSDFKTVFNMIDNGAKAYLLKDSTPEYVKATLHEVHTTGASYSSFVIDRLIEYQKEKETSQDASISDVQALLSALTQREVEFVSRCCSELGYKEIAETMGVSPRTADGYRQSVFDKLGLKSRAGIVLFAVDAGLYQRKISS